MFHQGGGVGDFAAPFVVGAVGVVGAGLAFPVRLLEPVVAHG